MADSMSLPHSTFRRRRRAVAAFLGLIALGAASASCSGGDDDAGTGSSASEVSQPVSSDDVFDSTDDGVTGSDAVAPPTAPEAPSASNGDLGDGGPDPETPVATDVVIARTVDGVAEEAGLDPDVEPVGFSTVRVRTTSATGDDDEFCVWLADTAAERSVGLMGVTSLGEPVGMAFVWDEPVADSFFMLDTPMPLSIAWFDGEGDIVGEADMLPCLDVDSASCDRYQPDGRYTIALEMVLGELADVGIGFGSTLQLVEGSEAPTCT